jgi:hypothetical protein
VLRPQPAGRPEEEAKRAGEPTVRVASREGAGKGGRGKEDKFNGKWFGYLNGPEDILGNPSCSLRFRCLVGKVCIQPPFRSEYLRKGPTELIPNPL